jgi:hypothetical protein
MSCPLTATGVFKRMSGLWLPDSQRSLFGAIDPEFIKKESSPLIAQVGGGEAGQAPSESARILFWGGSGCKMCDLNFGSVAIGTGCANAGKVVLMTSPKDDFSEGYFVAVEAIAEQMPVDSLTNGTTLSFGGIFRSHSRPGYSSSRTYTQAHVAAAISEPTTYINYPWPSANIIDYPLNSGGTYADRVQSTLGNLFGSGGSFGPQNAQGLYLMYRGANQADPVNDGTHVLTFTKYIVTCGTVSEGSQNETSKRALWTGIDGSQQDKSSIWIGIGEGYIKTGLGRAVFMPSMPISELKQDQWRQGETYWKVEATPGTLVSITPLLFQFALVYRGQTQQTAGLAALSAYGMNVLGTAVTEAPKSRALRSTLVKSPLGLIWKDYVFPGINADHTTKASRWPETVWPFEQPSQSVALSIGAAKEKPTSLSIKFETETKITSTYNSPAINAIVTKEILDKPIATIGTNSVRDEEGRIGRDLSSWYGQIQTATDYAQVPQRSVWQGVLDVEIQRLEQVKASTGSAFGLIQVQAPYIDNGLYWFGSSTQSAPWFTNRTDDYTFSVESIRPDTNSKAFWDGEYTATNVMPDGTQTAGDYFYASPDRSGDIVEAVPTMSLPMIANRSIATSPVVLWNSRDESGLGGGTVVPVNNYSYGLPATAPYEQQIGSLIRTTVFGGTGPNAFDPSWNKTLVGFGGWQTVSATHSATSKKLSVDVVQQRTQSLNQTVLVDTARGEGWVQKGEPGSNNNPSNFYFTGFPTPQSEFYKADFSRLDDVNERLCSVAKMSLIKSCKWIPKKTQMFCLLKRYTDFGGSQFSLPGGWGYYGGTVPDKDVLQMLDQYSSAFRGQNAPSGGEVFIVLRRSWQIELTIATGDPTYTPCQVIADNLQRYNGFIADNYGSPTCVRTSFSGTRQVKFTVSFDIDEAEEVTHKMNHESTSAIKLPMTEQQFTNFEDGQEISLNVSEHNFSAGYSVRPWGYYQGVDNIQARQDTIAKIKLN